MQPTLIRSLVLSLACAAAPIPAMAQQEPQQPAPSNETPPQQERPRRFGESRGEGRGDDRGEGRGEGREVGDGIGGGPGQFYRAIPPFEPPTAEEWEKAMAFMKEHAPKRWVLHLNQPEGAQQPIREFMFVRFRNLERVKNSDRDIYELQLRRLGIEDEIYALVYPTLSRTEPRMLTAEELSKLREKVTAQVDINIEERELRLQRIRDLLRREEDQLANDKAQRESAIAERVSFLERGRGVGRWSGGFVPRGGGMGGPRSGPGGPPPGERRPGP